MLLARLRTFTPRLAFRGILSKPPPIILGQKTTERDDSYKPRSAKDFLDVLSMEPLPPGSTPLGLRNLEDENEILTRPLRSTLKDQTYHIYVKSTNNNTIISLTDPEGNKLKGGSASGGLVGFKGVHRSGYEAGYQCALRIFNRVAELKKTVNLQIGDLKLELHLNGMMGQGREAVYRALMSQDGELVRNLICRVTDDTRIRVGGTRPKKRRIL